jgi:glycerol-3-phosphate acyltransferase PlsY
VIVGHLFPVWLRFRGGKGVATALGVLLVIAWPIAVAAAALWLATAAIYHYSSLAALVAAVASAALAAALVEPARAGLIAGIALLIILRHHDNIRRLLAGTESRISSGKG